MSSDIKITQSRDLYLKTLEAIASLPELDDEDFGDMLLEDLDIDARTFLSEPVLGRLVIAGLLSKEAAAGSLAIRCELLQRIDALHGTGEYTLAAMREDPLWLTLAGRCRSVLREQAWGPQGAA